MEGHLQINAPIPIFVKWVHHATAIPCICSWTAQTENINGCGKVHLLSMSSVTRKQPSSLNKSSPTEIRAQDIPSLPSAYCPALRRDRCGRAKGRKKNKPAMRVHVGTHHQHARVAPPGAAPESIITTGITLDRRSDALQLIQSGHLCQMQTHVHLRSSLLQWHEFHSNTPEGYQSNCSTLGEELSCPGGKIYWQSFAADISLPQKKTLEKKCI